MGADRDLVFARCFQVLCCVAAAIVVVIALQSGAVVQQQIKRSVCIDSEVHEEGMDIAGAARKLDGMLVTALVLLLLNVPMCLCTLLPSTTWLTLAVTPSFGLQLSGQLASWAVLVEQFPWDAPVGGLWCILYFSLWLFTKIVVIWIKDDTAMGLVLLDGVACTRCPTKCGCEFETAKDALQGAVTLLRASYWIAALLAVTSAGVLKSMAQNAHVRDGGGIGGGGGSSLSRSAGGYSALPVVAQVAEEGAAHALAPVQHNSVEVGLLPLQSSDGASEEQPQPESSTGVMQDV